MLKMHFYKFKFMFFCSSVLSMSENTIILPPANKAPLHSGNILTWIWYFLSPWKWSVFFFLGYRSMRYMWLSLVPFAIGFLVSGLESGAAFENTGHYITLMLCFMTGYLIFMINIIFVLEVRIVERAARALTLYSINHLNSMPLNWHEEQGSGGKLQRVMTARKGFQELIRHIRWDLFKLIGDILAITVTILVMGVPGEYAIYYMLFISSYLLASWYFALPFLNLYDSFHQKFEDLLSGVYEFVSAIRTVKAFNLNESIFNRARHLEEIGQEAIMKTFSSNLLRWTICNVIGALWLFFFAWTGFHDVLAGNLSVGSFTTIFFLAANMWASCEILGSIWEKVYEHGNAISRLVNTLRVKPEQMDLSPAQELPKDWKTIALDNIIYTYDNNDSQGIKGVSFKVKRGEKIAFVGNSGAGKSTLVKLLMKQMLPQSGEFKVDDAHVPYIVTGDWLSQIGFVPQDVELFNLSIRDNILIDREDVDGKLLQKVLEQSALAEFVESLPGGLDTIIGERGIKLSGGQRQRLGIARALIRQAPIMIFDEATSSLDSISEAKIQTAIENSFEDRTVFVIAHRLSTVKNVDRIIVLDNGHIIEDGSFDVLIKKKGHFAKLWSIQSGGTI